MVGVRKQSTKTLQLLSFGANLVKMLQGLMQVGMRCCSHPWHPLGSNTYQDK